MSAAWPTVTIVIPTYRREQVLLDTLSHLLALGAPADEVLVVDQTERHEPDTERTLRDHAAANRIRWRRLPRPSIPHAMNIGLREARGDVVLFLDDDVVPSDGLVDGHRRAHAASRGTVIAGRVVQPWEDAPGVATPATTSFSAAGPGPRSEFMGGNFSIARETALRLGGFDENFVHVAYRFEAEFAARLRAAGHSIHYEPAASIHHRKATAGGTRAYGDHLRTIRPSHAVGAYYFALRSRPRGWWLQVLARPWRSVRTRHHLRKPWWIPATFLAEATGFLWALFLFLRGPRLVAPELRISGALAPQPR